MGGDREYSDLNLESSDLGLRGGSGMVGLRMSIQIFYSSRPSGGVVFLRNLMLEVCFVGYLQEGCVRRRREVSRGL